MLSLDVSRLYPDVVGYQDGVRGGTDEGVGGGRVHAVVVVDVLQVLLDVDGRQRQCC